MTGSPFAALVAWGTSNFRLWIVDAGGGVLAERQSDDGMGRLERDRFGAVLEGHLQALSAPADLPVVIAGMAGARSGWLEAAYVETPAPLQGLFRHAVMPEHSGRRVFILPGVCQRTAGAEDVMRGEETQLAGAIESGIASGLFCLPGTHSKWAELDAGTVRGFTTAMTGELFQLLSRQSILRLSVPEDVRAEADHPAFAAGVSEAAEPDFSLTTRLFSIRAEGLLGAADGASAAARLSGLLIGAEVAAMRRRYAPAGDVHIIGTGALASLYTRALALSGIRAVALDGGKLVRKGLFAAARSLVSVS